MNMKSVLVVFGPIGNSTEFPNLSAQADEDSGVLSFYTDGGDLVGQMAPQNWTAWFYKSVIEEQGLWADKVNGEGC